MNIYFFAFYSAPVELFLFIAYKRRCPHKRQHKPQYAYFKKAEQNSFSNIADGNFQIYALGACEKGGQGKDTAEYRIDKEKQQQLKNEFDALGSNIDYETFNTIVKKYDLPEWSKTGTVFLCAGFCLFCEFSFFLSVGIKFEIKEDKYCCGQ